MKIDHKKFLEEILDNEKYRELYNNSPFFNKAITSIAHGADESEIIYQLCYAIQEQQDMMRKLAFNNHPSIILKRL